jgi:predicted acyltransferase
MIKNPSRLHSIDVLRSFNMFFMIFVNDLSGVRNVPEWIDHVRGDVDGMHFADTIFPLFLFIAGLSLPIAISKRLSKGDSFGSIAFYIFLRSFALIVMGFFHVNMEDYDVHNSLTLTMFGTAYLIPLSLGVWEFFLTLSFFLIWLDYPETLAKFKRYTLTGAGVVLLVTLGLLYKGGTPVAPRGLTPEWWGILGIIGWAYLVCAVVFLVFKGNFAAMCVALAVFVAINIGSHGHWINYHIWVVQDGNSTSLMMFGVVFSLLYYKFVSQGKYGRIWLVFTLAGLAVIAFGFFVRPYTEGISKIHSTPSWVLICSGIGIILFEFFIWLIDVKAKAGWFKIIKPAGTSTLTCYLIPYFMVAIFAIVRFTYPDFLSEGTGGIIRSFAVCFVVIFITGFLEKKRLRLKV